MAPTKMDNNIHDMQLARSRNLIVTESGQIFSPNALYNGCD